MNESGLTLVRADLTLCDGTIECAGQRFTPDGSKAYVEARFSYSFPVVPYYGITLHPGTIANSVETMLHQRVDINHLVKIYNPEEITRDRIIGAVVAVEFPRAPLGGWKIPKRAEEAPGIRAVLSVFKQAEGVDRILGQHQSGRHKWTVSQEYFHNREDGVFLVREKPEDGDPDDIATHGMRAIAFKDAPNELKTTLPSKPMQRIKPWKKGNREIPVVFLAGGINGFVHYEGVGIVQMGAEAAAEIDRVAAGGEAVDPAALEFLEASRKFLAFAQKGLTSFSKDAGTEGR